MNLTNWFNRGISTEDYTATLDNHRDGFHHIYNQFSIPDVEIEQLKEKSTERIIVLAEVWCGHCMLNIPILLRLAEAAQMDVSFLPRDSHLELMDQYLTDSKRFIPIFIFLDENGNEVGKWGPMAPEVESFVDEHKKDLPEKDSPAYEEAWLKFIQLTSDRFINDSDLWLDIYKDIKKSIK